jgi:hypothetical protein
MKTKEGRAEARPYMGGLSLWGLLRFRIVFALNFLCGSMLLGEIALTQPALFYFR